VTEEDYAESDGFHGDGFGCFLIALGTIFLFAVISYVTSDK